MSILDGILVIEMCEVWQGPLAGQTLADYGARVIKVERPPSGDLMRSNDFIASRQGRTSCYFAATNSNKESICLDIKSEDGRAALNALIKSADVLISNYRPGAMDRLGYGYDAASAFNPRLIYAVASGYGETGPLARMAGQDLLAQAVSGIATKHTASGAGPVLLNTPVTDFASGMILVQGILLALLERQKSGLGQKVSISLFDSAVAMQGLEIASMLNHDAETNWFESGPNFLAQTSDGWVVVLGFYRENPLQLMCRALELDDLSARPEFNTLEQQIVRRKEIADLLRPAMLKLSSDDATARFQTAGILAAPIATLRDMLASPQLANNQLLRSVPIEGEPDMTVVSHPLRLSRTPQQLRMGPPKLGQHTQQILDALRLQASAIPEAAGQDQHEKHRPASVTE
jgi:crotonobetainyl-CoA:carnitine CoA-transferase CaiB-like acyl-CoA transferase